MAMFTLIYLSNVLYIGSINHIKENIKTIKPISNNVQKFHRPRLGESLVRSCLLKLCPDVWNGYNVEDDFNNVRHTSRFDILLHVSGIFHCRPKHQYWTETQIRTLWRPLCLSTPKFTFMTIPLPFAHKYRFLVSVFPRVCYTLHPYPPSVFLHKADIANHPWISISVHHWLIVNLLQHFH